jgi:hypothetical protein
MRSSQQTSSWSSGPDHRVSVDTHRQVATLDFQSRNRAQNRLIYRIPSDTEALSLGLKRGVTG